MIQRKGIRRRSSRRVYLGLFDHNHKYLSHLSHRELRERKMFFWLFHSGWNETLMKLLPLALKVPGVALPIISYTLKRFYGGRNLLECQDKVKELVSYKISSTLDYCIEHAQDHKSYHQNLTELQRALELAGKDPATIPFVVFKLSALCPTSLLAQAQDNPASLCPSETDLLESLKDDLNTLCAQAQSQGVRILIDAEESWIQGTIDHIVEDLMERYNHGSQPVVYHTVQMYRVDRLEYLTKLHEKFHNKKRILGIKLVRGAYLEKERERAKKLKISSPLHTTKKLTDQAFDEAMMFCLKHRKEIFVYLATHNESSIEKLISALKESSYKTADESLWFAQLLGMGDHISYFLADQGHHTSKYIPYGPLVSMVPYLVRRAQENSSLEGHGKREYELLSQEWSHRKQAPISGEKVNASGKEV